MNAGEVAELYRRYAPLVHARAKRIVGADADEIVQEVFLKLLDRPPAPDRATAWIYATSTNLCLDRLRYRARRDEAWWEDAREAFERQRPAGLAEALGRRDLVRRLLARADRRTRTLAALVYVDGMTQQEAGDMLGVSRKTVNKRLERFRADAAEVVERWIE